MIFAISLLSPLRKKHGPSFKKTWFPIAQGCFVPSLVDIGPVVLKKWIFKLRQCIFAISLSSPLEKGWGHSLNKLDFSSPKNALCQVWLKLALWFLRRRFLKFVNVFWLFWYYLPLEKGLALPLNKLEFPPPMDAAKFAWNWPCGS